MANATIININIPPANDKGVITAAKITSIVAFITALILAFATILGAGIQAFGSWYQKATELGCFQDWKEIARKNDWIPRTECQWNATIATGSDKNGKEMKVKINLLSSEYRWICNSSEGAELGNEKVDLSMLVQGLDISTNSQGLIAIGMASVEGNISDQSILSEQRTDKLIVIIKDKLKPKIPVYGLSLGRFKNEDLKTTCKETSTQRRVVIVEIIRQDEGVNVQEAILNALEVAKKESPPIPFDINDYFERNFTDRGFRRN